MTPDAEVTDGAGAGAHAGYRILMVEDNPGDARLIREHLQQAGTASELLEAGSLEEARSILAENRPDVCLLDQGLPDSSGSETVARFRQFGNDLPVVVLTGLADRDAAIAAIQAGADEYLRAFQTS